MKIKQAYLDWLIIPAAFVLILSVAESVGRTGGWWPESFLKRLVIYVSIGAALGLILRLIRPSE